MKQHMTLRLAPELIERIDKYAQSLQAQTGLEVKRADAIRLLLTSGLDVKEKELGGRKN